MLSQRTMMGLKGTNIHLPNRYKIRKFHQYKNKNEKNEEPPLSQKQQEQSPLIIEMRQPIEQKKSKSKIRERTLNVQMITSIPKLTLKEEVELEKEIVSAGLVFKKNHDCNSLKGRQFYSSTKTKRCACGDCEECMKDFTYFLHLFSDDQSVPQISAKSWCIWKRKNGKFMYHYGKRIHKVREIASLSKMITGMTAVDYLNKYQFDPAKIAYQIKKSSVMIGGTTANLKEGEVYTLLELFYGMMLPSGNDAAIAISEIIGLLSFVHSKNRIIDPTAPAWYEPFQNKNFSYLFIGLMNQKCQKIGTLDTHMFNSHGNDAYDQLKNISTCNQIAKISSEFMNYQLLREIVRTPVYGKFQNTNKLLQDGFDGIKTGITDTAGPCLAASYKDYIIVVLNSKSMNERWIEVKKLVKWIIKKS